MRYLSATICALFILSGCKATANGETSDSTNQIPNGSETFTQEQRVLADQIISVFENNSPIIQYGYIENLDDGRGYTAGRAGFTSATGDMLEVITNYAEIIPQTPLAAYIPRLDYLAEHKDGSIIGLEGLEQAWQTSALNSTFRAVQDNVVDNEYYFPAVAHAEQIGAHYPLTLLNLYDAIIQHGDGEDPDGLPALIEKTNQTVGGTPKAGVDETLWLQAFMDIRRADLIAPSNQATQQEWSESVGRVDTLQQLYQDHNYSLNAPIIINTWGDTFTLPSE